MSVRRLAIAIAVVTLVASGTYVIVYLARWEWNRAMIAGLLFVATEIALATIVLLGRIASTARGNEARTPDPRTLEAVRASAPAPRRRLEWLDTDGPAVFVPVLLGAGVIVSIFAMIVERLAQATARPGMERRLALRLTPLLLADDAGSVIKREPKAPSRRRPFVQALVVLGLSVGVAAGIDALGDLTQTRPHVAVAGTRTTMVVRIETNARPRSPLEAAQRLWETCRGRIAGRLAPSGIVQVGPGTMRIDVIPSLGLHQTRRFRGCFEDMTLDKVRADVISINHLSLEP